jgi:glycerol-3-phosphate acyltransferase PlsY
MLIQSGNSTNMLAFSLLLVAAYLIGSIPMAFLVVKWRFRVDIRHYGSGQVGGSNVFRTFSKPWGVAVGLFDALKGALMLWIGSLLGMTLTMDILIGLAAIVGHNWPVFLKFNAGRGLATSLGVAFLLFPWGIPIFVAVVVFTLVRGSSPLPVLIGMMALPLASWLLQEPLTVTLGLTGLLLLLVIRRITAPRNGRSTTVSNRELLLNRFLFDRDIRDGKSWIKPTKIEQTPPRRKD